MTQPAEQNESGRDDGELLQAFVQGRSQAAFAEIARRHGGMVLAVCRSVLGDAADAEDAAQAVFLTLARKAGSFKRPSQLAGWLHKVAWYVSARAGKARAIRRRREQEAARMRHDDAPARQEAVPLDALHAGLAQLPERYRVPLLLHHLEGRTQEETAALLGCGVSAVAMRLNRGREMLRKRLGRRGIGLSAMALAALLVAQSSASASPAFVGAAAKVAAGVLAGQLAAAGTISAQTLALAKGAMNMLFWAKMKVAAAVVAATVAAGGLVSAGIVLAQGTTPPSMTGMISQVSADSITLKRSGGDATAAINASTVVKVNGAAGKAADLQAGMNAIVFVVTGQPATEIRAYTPKPSPSPSPSPSPTPRPSFYGSITQVGDGSITVKRPDGNTASATYNDATVVKIAGVVGKASDLQVGMTAGVFVVAGQPATQIVAYMPKPPSPSPSPSPAAPSISGSITAVGNGSITVKRSDGSTASATYNDSTVVKVNTAVGKAADLQVGMSAIVFVVAGQPATEIRAYTPKPSPSPSPAPTIYGKITAVGNGSITLAHTDGTTATATYNDATVVKIGGAVGKAADLAVGMNAYVLVVTGQPATQITAYTPKPAGS